MPSAKDRVTTDYVTALLVYVRQPEPKPPPRRRGRGRPRALETIRHKGRVLKAIAEISLKNPKLQVHFAGRLGNHHEFKHLKDRTLQRDVAAVLKQLEDWLADLSPNAFAFRCVVRMQSGSRATGQHGSFSPGTTAGFSEGWRHEERRCRLRAN
jgi:hypothetical protein